MANVVIPEDVFKNRCPWCHHGRVENGNEGVPSERLFYARYHDSLPCAIMGINKADKIPGECLSFHQNWIYGICGTCYFSNQFHEGFCRNVDGPKNKRIVFLGMEYNGNEYWNHARSTCDHYTVNPRVKDLIMMDVLRGKSPANFDPDTWEPLEELEGSPAATQWQMLKDEARQKEEARKKEEAKRQESKRAAVQEPAEEQLSLF